MRRRGYAIAALVLLAALAGCGSDSTSGKAAGPGDARTVQLEMRDIAYSPTAVDVRVGERIRFVFTNAGQVTHDAFIGDAAAQDGHEKEMRGGPADHGGTSNAVSVKPGKSASLIYTFDTPGQVLIGCHQPGHYTGGMKATVSVA